MLGTLAFSVASFMGLLLVYGLNQWLPTIMRDAGYALGAALAFLLVLNLGAVIGLLVAGPVADRYGSKVVCAGWFAFAAVFLFLLSVQMPLFLTYLAVIVTGVFVFSAQVLLYAYVSKHYPTSGRGTALGWAAGIGRLGAICGPLLGGLLVGAGLAVPWGFYAFALVGLLGAVFISLVPRSPVEERQGRRRPDAVTGMTGRRCSDTGRHRRWRTGGAAALAPPAPARDRLGRARAPQPRGAGGEDPGRRPGARHGRPPQRDRRRRAHARRRAPSTTGSTCSSAGAGTAST